MPQEAPILELEPTPSDDSSPASDEVSQTQPNAAANKLQDLVAAGRMGAILQKLEAMADSHGAHNGTLEKIEAALAAQEPLQRLMGDAKQVIEQRNVVNKAMFEALHAELKGYKDGFLMEALQRPIIRDLISIYDDTSDLLRQLKASIAAQESRGGVTGAAVVLLENVGSVCVNMEHNIEFVIEVLERMDVTMMPMNTGKLDKQRQRVNSIEATDDSDLDQTVVKVLKRGFQWKERVVRAEEVVVYKWTATIEITPAAPKPSSSSRAANH